MADPVLGTDVLIQFMKGGNYLTYGCATEISIEYSMETKGVKTVGDGVWRRKKGQSLGSVINLSGVDIIDANRITAFDLLDYFKNMVDIAYKLFFQDRSGGLKVIQGNALPTNVKLGGGSEGHATGDITLECNGDPDYITPPDPNDPDNPPNPDECIAEIEAAHTAIVPSPPFAPRRYLYIDSMVSGSATISRWDYTIDGGGIQTKFTDGTIPASWILPLAVTDTGHSITITPICDNGFSGMPFTLGW